MKYFLAAAFVAVLGSALSVPVQNRSGDRVLDLVKAAAKFAAKIGASQDPTWYPNIIDRHIYEPAQKIDLMFSSTNSKLHQFSEISLANTVTDPVSLTANFTLLYPNAVFDGLYSVTGNAFDRKTSGEGQFSIQTIKPSITFSVRFAEDESTKALSIPSLSNEFGLDAIDAKFNKLQVEGMTEEQVEQFLDEKLLETFNNMKSKLEFWVAQLTLSSLNALTNGKTMEEITQWLEQQDATSSEAAQVFSTIVSKFASALALNDF